MRKVSNEVSKSRRALATGLAMGALAMEIADTGAEQAVESNQIVLDILSGELHPIEATIQLMNEQGYNAWRSEAVDAVVEGGVEPGAIVRFNQDQSAKYAEQINKISSNLTGKSIYESDIYDIQQGEKVLVGYYREGDKSE